ncbi:hypothetical protein JOF55_000974 [Haloactinomyces albus]|uniref:Uncharacterized protein n=1 Tax=Haloactinomyces albus TaxID=1352928 RepID=A0AAE4CNL7_9ACTN|nr:hypothetical protein [Haloactinomyces albus]
MATSVIVALLAVASMVPTGETSWAPSAGASRTDGGFGGSGGAVVGEPVREPDVLPHPAIVNAIRPAAVSGSIRRKKLLRSFE